MSQVVYDFRQPLRPSCGTCARGWRTSLGKVACGAAVDTTAHPNAIWAVRKYSTGGLIQALSGQVVRGSDCENMDAADGATCAAWKQPAGPLSGSL